MTLASQTPGPAHAVDDLATTLRRLRSFADFRRALRSAENEEAVATATIAFARSALDCAEMTIYCAETIEADFEMLATSAASRDALLSRIEREGPLAQRLLTETVIRDREMVGPSSTALALRDDTSERLVGIALLVGDLDPAILDELVFDTETALAARVMTRVRAEELAVLEVQERELVSLLREVQERDAIIQKDLEEAREFQRRTLGAPPRVEGAAIEIVYRPLGQVGGDLYAVSLQGNRLRLFIADATGHGVSASLTTMFIKSVYDTVSASANEPGLLLEAVNEGIARNYKGAQMVFSASCVDLDVVTGELMFSSAAHPPLCLVRGGKATHVEGGGALLGVRLRMRFETQRLSVAKGDGIYLYTDGFTETPGPGGEQFGEPRLLSTVEDAHVRGVLAGKALDEAVSAFAGKPELSDDATFVGVQFGVSATKGS